MEPKELLNLSPKEESQLYKQLESIHKSVKSRFVYATDQKVWNQREHWENYHQIPDNGDIIGDCDCFAMACRKECRKLSIPSRLIFCFVEDNGRRGGHLVLSCKGWILDNRQWGVVGNTSLPYEWISMSGYERGGDWHIIKSDKRFK